MNTITWAPPGPEGPQTLALNAGEQGARSSNATVVSCPHCTTFSRVFYGTRSAMYQWPSRRLLSDRITYTCLPREGFNKEEARLNYVHVLEFKSHCRLEHPSIEYKVRKVVRRHLAPTTASSQNTRAAARKVGARSGSA